MAARSQTPFERKPSEKWLWGLVLGNLGVFDGVPAELQMVPDGRNGHNGRCNRCIPLAVGLLLFTRSYCCSVVTVNSNNTVQRLTLTNSSRARRGARRVASHIRKSESGDCAGSLSPVRSIHSDSRVVTLKSHTLIPVSNRRPQE